MCVSYTCFNVEYGFHLRRYSGVAVQTGCGHVPRKGLRLPGRTLSNELRWRRWSFRSTAPPVARTPFNKPQMCRPFVFLPYSQRQAAGHIRDGDAGHAHVIIINQQASRYSNHNTTKLPNCTYFAKFTYVK